MASIHRQSATKFWIAHYTDKNGKRRAKSTFVENTTANRKKAQRVADSYEEIFRARNQLRCIRDAYAGFAKELNVDWKIPTVSNFLDEWKKTFFPRLAESTQRAYLYRFNDFVDFLKSTEREGCYVDMVSVDVAREYRDQLLTTVSTVTVNIAFSTLSGAFQYAVQKGYIIENAFDVLGNVAEIDATEKRAFTLDELKLVLRHCTGEWRSLVLFGLYTGQRISDLATLTWGQIDLERNEVSFITKKTKRRMALPIAKPLQSHIVTLTRGTPDAPVHPNAERMMREQGKAGTLSRQFNEVLQKAGLVPKKSHHKGKDGTETESRRVRVNPLSFHSLRHTAATLLRTTGTNEAVAREIIGHDSTSVDRGYVHIDAPAMQTALDKLPDIRAG